MYMFVCVCVCVCVCARARVYNCIHACMHAYIYIYIYIYMIHTYNTILCILYCTIYIYIYIYIYISGHFLKCSAPPFYERVIHHVVLVFNVCVHVSSDFSRSCAPQGTTGRGHHTLTRSYISVYVCVEVYIYTQVFAHAHTRAFTCIHR
jgi:hypothetical protein